MLLPGFRERSQSGSRNWDISVWKKSTKPVSIRISGVLKELLLKKSTGCWYESSGEDLRELSVWGGIGHSQ